MYLNGIELPVLCLDNSVRYLTGLEWLVLTHRPVYSILTELPAVYLLYDSSVRSTIFLFLLFGVSVWNGGGFYIEVSISLVPLFESNPCSPGVRPQV